MNSAALKIDSEQDCKRWLAQLPLTNAQQAQGAIIAQLKLLNGAAVPARQRLQIMEALRSAVAYVQAERMKRPFNQPVPLDPPGAAIWNDVIGLWDAMLQSYEGCVAVDAMYLPQVYQRALDYAGLAAADCDENPGRACR